MCQPGDGLSVSVEELEGLVFEFARKTADEQPDIDEWALSSLLAGAFRGLRELVEDGDVAWPPGLVSLPYHVDYDWETLEPRLLDVSDEAIKKAAAGDLTDVNSASAKAFVRMMHWDKLIWISSGLRWIIEDGRGSLDSFHEDVVEAIGHSMTGLTHEEHDARLDALREPVFVGEEVPGPDTVIADFDGVETEVKTLRYRLTVPVNKDGKPLILCLIFGVCPGVVDLDELDAYYPLVVSFYLMDSESNIVCIDDWSQEDRSTFWDELLTFLDGSTDTRWRVVVRSETVTNARDVEEVLARHERVARTMDAALVNEGIEGQSTVCRVDGEKPSDVSSRETSDYDHSPDFTSVRWAGVNYAFNKGQAAAVGVLWDAWMRRVPRVSESTIGEKIGSAAMRFRLRDLFRSKSEGPHPAWKVMIVTDGDGVFRLDDRNPRRTPA